MNFPINSFAEASRVLKRIKNLYKDYGIVFVAEIFDIIQEESGVITETKYNRIYTRERIKTLRGIEIRKKITGEIYIYIPNPKKEKDEQLG